MPKDWRKNTGGLYYCHGCNEWHYKNSPIGKKHWKIRHRRK